MPEIVMDTGRDAVLLVGGGSLCAAAVPLLRAAGLVPAGVIHGLRCDFAAEAGVPPLGRDADLARLRRDFSRAVVTAPHKQAARLRRLLHEALREQGFTLVLSLIHICTIAARHSRISHVYYRPSAAPDWPYELYTMVHGRSEQECLDVAQELIATTPLREYAILKSLKELKKISMTYF